MLLSKFQERFMVKINYHRLYDNIITNKIIHMYRTGKKNRNFARDIGPVMLSKHKAYEIGFKPGDLFSRGGSTTVRLYDRDTGDLVAQETAFCGLSDNFCKHAGREIALGRIAKKLNECQNTKNEQ